MSTSEQSWHQHDRHMPGRHEMDPPLCGPASMSQNEFYSHPTKEFRFSGPGGIYRERRYCRGGLTMLTITNATVSHDEVWRAYRHTHDVRLRERYHCIGSVLDVEM